MEAILVTILLAAITATLWLSHGFASMYQLFGTSALPVALHIAASVSAAILFVVVLSQIVVRLGFSTVLHAEPTGLQRGLVLAVFSFIAAAAVLAHFGLDLSTILTTSALITAIVGLSIQPMLGSLMSGLSLNRFVRIGDGIVLGDDTVVVTSLNWRSVVGRKGSGSSVVMPNGRLSDGTLEVLAHDRPAQAKVVIAVPSSMTPHALAGMVNGIMADIVEVDPGNPISLEPIISAGGQGSTGYRISYWVRHFSQRAPVGETFLRRMWYALQRETAKASLQPAADSLPSAELLTYGGEEPIVLPARAEGHGCLLVEGKLSELSAGGSPRPRREMTRQAAIAEVQRLLALRIGPYAEYAVSQAAAVGGTIADICDTVAAEIDDATEREAFCAAVNAPGERIHGPGFSFVSAADMTERLVSVPPLRAVDYAVILAAPAAAPRP